MSVLDRIMTYKREEVDTARAALPLADLSAQVADTPAPRGFRAALRRDIVSNGKALIAEVKKASPSKGLIREDFAPVRIAHDYARGGATCLSILTDTPSFQGHPQFLRDVRACVDLPLLRKDFLCDVYQVYEARVWGSDCILIIMAAVDDALAQDLSDTARALGLDVLVEVHDKEELERALTLQGIDMIGINNRNLKTFETSLDVSVSLAPLVPQDVLLVGESGIFAPDDITYLSRAGIRSYLVGESLMRQDDVTAAVRALMA